MPKKRGAGERTIYKRKDGRWSAQLTVGVQAYGTPKRVTYYGKIQHEVHDKISNAKAARQKGTFVEPSSATLGEWLVEWLSEYKKNSLESSTWSSYEIQVRCHIVPEIGHIRLQDLSPDQVQRLYNKKLQEGLSGPQRTLHPSGPSRRTEAGTHQQLRVSKRERSDEPPASRAAIYTPTHAGRDRAADGCRRAVFSLASVLYRC